MLSALRPFSLQTTTLPTRAGRSVRTSDPQDTATLSSQTPPPSKGMTLAGKATALFLALGIGLFASGVAIEHYDPIVPHPEQVTMQQIEQARDGCLAQLGAKLSTDQTQLDRVQQISHTLEPYQSETYTFRVVNNGIVNAASCGKGTVLIEEKVAKLLDDKELRFVMAHEQGHDELGHLQQTISYLDQGSWRLTVPILNIDPRAGYTLWARGHELAADCYAVRITGDAAAGASALQKTMTAAGDTHGVGGGTHPGLAERVQNMNSCPLQPGPA